MAKTADSLLTCSDVIKQTHGLMLSRRFATQLATRMGDSGRLIPRDDVGRHVEADSFSVDVLRIYSVAVLRVGQGPWPPVSAVPPLPLYPLTKLVARWQVE